MKYLSCLSFLCLSTALALTGCGGSDTQTANNAAPSQAASPTGPTAASVPAAPAPVAPATPAPAASSPAASAPSEATGGQTYRDTNGLFEVSLPQGYSYEETGSGITFASGDGGFGGSVDFGSAQGKTLTTQQLEEALKQEYENRLDDVSWQDSQLQPDGSVRVDWVGRDTGGNDLDAISFVEQRGDTIFILNLFGINKPYNDYNSDAQAIVGSYRVRQ
jgi:hypothetical protein